MQVWWPDGAVACSFSWQLPQEGGFAGACATAAPWHCVQSAWPLLAAASFVSGSWHFAQMVRRSGGEKSCGV